MTDLNKDLNACGRNRPNHYKSPRLVRCESEMDYDAPVLLSQWQLMVLGSFWLPTLFFFNAFISFLIPNISLEVSGSNKSATLGYTFTASALLSIVVVPIVGALSDRTTFSMVNLFAEYYFLYQFILENTKAPFLKALYLVCN
jgi:hypothetical protein